MSNIEIVRITFKAAIVTKLKNHQKRFLASADTVHLLQKECTYIIENSHIWMVIKPLNDDNLWNLPGLNVDDEGYAVYWTP